MKITGTITKEVVSNHPHREPFETGTMHVDLAVTFDGEKDGDLLREMHCLSDAIIRIAHRGIPGVRM